MKKETLLNLIRYHFEKNEDSFKNECINVARYFDQIGDDELSQYVLGLMYDGSSFGAQSFEVNFDDLTYLKKIDVNNINPFNLPEGISEDINGVINAINHNIGINKFLFQGDPGSGKTEAAKRIANLLNRDLYIVDFGNLVDSKLGQTNKNIVKLFEEINQIATYKKAVVLFDEIDVIAMDRINTNDIREMGRATSTILKEFDQLAKNQKDVVIIATTNLFSNFDKALTRRFDAIINFNRYTKEELINVAETFFNFYVKKFKNVSKDIKLFKKILSIPNKLPYPGELQNIIKSSLAFSSPDSQNDYLKRLYNSLNKNIDNKSFEDLHREGFTIREIEKLKGESKSSVARKLNKGDK